MAGTRPTFALPKAQDDKVGLVWPRFGPAIAWKGDAMTTCALIVLAMLGDANRLGAGDHRRELAVDGRDRDYLIHVPRKRAPAAGWPIVLIYHGGGTNADLMMRVCGMNDKADEAGFLAVYPNGTGRVSRVLTFNAGNCCGVAQRDGVDDVKFTHAVLDDLRRLLAVDRKRIYATGMSNGAIMAYRVASEMADRIAAIAPVAGPMGTRTCSPSQPVPVCHFHGTADAFAPYKGGKGTRSLTKTDFFSVDHSIKAWVRANGCRATPQIQTLRKKIEDGTSVTKFIYAGGKQGAEVVLYRIEGMGHTWPGIDSGRRFLGATTKNISANDVMWEFFQRHARR